MPLFYEDHPLLPIPSFYFKFYPTLPPFLVALSPHPMALFCLLSLAEWVISPHLKCYFT